MRSYALVLGVLAVWRITHLFVAEDGPGEVMVRLRRRAGSGFWGSLLDCFYCLSLWFAAPIAWLLSSAVPTPLPTAAPAGDGGGWAHGVLLWLALSGGASLLERWARPGPGVPAALYSENPLEEDGHVLRQAEKPVGDEPTGLPQGR